MITYHFGRHLDSISDSLSYPVGDNMPAAINWARAAAETFNSIEEFQGRTLNLICRGSSGAILAALFSSFVKNESFVLHVKKPGEDSHHSNYSLPRTVRDNGRINVVIDDFISSGHTVKEIMKAIEKKTVDCIVANNSSSADTISDELDFRYAVSRH